MELSELEIGTKLELEIFNDDGNKLEHMLVSELEWLEGTSKAVIAAPIFEGYVYPIRIGTIMNVYFISKWKSYINYFSVSAVVRNREMTDDLHFLSIELTGEIKKVQRRMYYRLDCTVGVQYKLADTINATDSKDIPYKKTIANNLSGGGISLMLEEKLEIGSFLQCEVLTDQNRKIRFLGKIIRYVGSGLEGKFKYEAGIAYIEINNSDREAVVQYIFSEQRKLRKKGLI